MSLFQLPEASVGLRQIYRTPEVAQRALGAFFRVRAALSHRPGELRLEGLVRPELGGALLAAWSVQSSVALLPRGLESSGEGLHLTPETLGDLPIPTQAECPGPIVLPAEQVVATFWTSGSTGRPQAFAKTAQQLLGEAESLIEWLALDRQDVVLPTVVSAHIYGLLFSFLAPYLAGAAVIEDQASDPANFHPFALSRSAETHRASVMVTVPAHLRSLVEAAVELRTVRKVVSSAAPLAPEWAAKLEEQTGGQVFDVLGSTETGGIAVRRPSVEESWTPLPGVVVGADPAGRMLLDSPFLRHDERPRHGDDQVRLLDEGRFLHEGRSDGVVKIGGRRTSLREIELAAQQLPGVRAVAALAELASGLRGLEIWLVVEGEGLDSKTLRRALRQRLDPVFVPRKIRVVPQLPTDERGKLSRGGLLALFAPAALRWGAREQTETIWRAELSIPRETPRVRGHFPSEPIVPAVAQLLDIVAPAAEKWLSATVVQLSRGKWLQPIRPGDELVLELRRGAPRGELLSVRYLLSKGEGAAASGTLLLQRTA